MTNSDAIALRIEWQGQGPFWCDRANKRLIRLCRQATPEWKQTDLDCATFLEHYAACAPSPHDHPMFDWHLSRLKDNDTSLVFGFTNVASLHEQFGLDQPLYRKQFQALLEQPEFSVTTYLVHPLAQSDHEVLYRRGQAEIIDVARTWDDVQAL